MARVDLVVWVARVARVVLVSRVVAKMAPAEASVVPVG